VDKTRAHFDVKAIAASWENMRDICRRVRGSLKGTKAMDVFMSREAGRVKTRLIKKLLAALNAAPDRVCFPKGAGR